MCDKRYFYGFIGKGVTVSHGSFLGKISAKSERIC